MYIFSSRLRFLSLFFLLYTSIGTLIALNAGNIEFVLYAGIVFIISALVILMDKRVTFPIGLLWGLAIWGYLHFAGGLLPIPESVTEPGKSSVLYNLRLFPWFPKFDQLIHAYGFGLSTLIAYEAMCAHFGKRLEVCAPVIAMLALIGLGLGCVNEIIEFIAVVLVPETNVGGYMNTGWDMVSNGVGVGLAVIWLCIKKAETSI